ncbi:2TM domain-containing protein [Pseudotenacibaculum sp. MALMAid0570]|uniref:2TM domain-containing protein n=1 Tax=Pseudotenacibaculum sp. MALMAid0570 TaxID=3143938 RepID=UPI0032DE3F79
MSRVILNQIKMEQNYIKEQQYLKAKKRIKDIKGFYSHLSVYIVVNIFISGIIVYGLSNDEDRSLGEALTHFGTYSTWLFWGIGLFFHWLGVFGFKSFFGKSWEEKKIKELMDKDDEVSRKILKK